MWWQKASNVVYAADTGGLRYRPKDGARHLRGYHCEIILRELQTLAGHAKQLDLWTRLAKEVADKYS